MTSTPRHDPEEMRDASCRDRVLVDLVRAQLAYPADRPSPDDAVAEASIQLHGAQRKCGDRLLQHPAKPGRRARRAHRILSLQQRLFKTGGRLIQHARYFILQLAESHLTQRLVSVDPWAPRATRVAAHLIESTAHGERGGAGSTPAGVPLRWVVGGGEPRCTRGQQDGHSDKDALSPIPNGMAGWSACGSLSSIRGRR